MSFDLAHGQAIPGSFFFSAGGGTSVLFSQPSNQPLVVDGTIIFAVAGAEARSRVVTSGAPEPATAALVALGSLLVGLRRRR